MDIRAFSRSTDKLRIGEDNEIKVIYRQFTDTKQQMVYRKRDLQRCQLNSWS